MTEKDVLKNIRKNNIFTAIGTGIFVLGLNAVLFIFIIDGINEGFETSTIVFIVLFGGISLLVDNAFAKAIVLIIYPFKDDVFKKYGSPTKIVSILKEIEKTKIYEDKHLIISNNYISDKKDYNKIVKCSDVLGVHKLVHKTNYAIDYYQIVITDKYKHEITYQYGVKESDKVDQLLIVIGSMCPNAELGYSKKEWDHIKNNSIKLPKSTTETFEDADIKEEASKSKKYKCPDCDNNIEYNDKFCKECGCKIDWS